MNVNINTYTNFLIDSYNLHTIWKTFSFWLFLNVYTRETFYWYILLKTQKNKNHSISQGQKEEDLKPMITVLFIILIFSCIFDIIYQKNKIKLINDLCFSHIDYTLKHISNMPKKEILTLNMNETFSYIELVCVGLKNIIEKKQLIINLSAVFITVIISLRKVNVFLILSLLALFNFIINKLQKKSADVQINLEDQSQDLINNLRNYLLDSKQKFVNDNFNHSYCINLYDRYCKNRTQLINIQNKFKTLNQLMILMITFFIIISKYKTSSLIDIFVYLLIIYDLDNFVWYSFEIYKNSLSYTKVNLALKHLFTRFENFKEKNFEYSNINSLKINTLNNSSRNIFLNLENKLEFKKGDNILCSGDSGQGKTTFFKFLKDIEKPDNIDIEMDGKKISTKDICSKVFLVLQGNRPSSDIYLYDFITNYSETPNKDMIIFALNISNLQNKITGEENIYINIENLSGGEKNRLALAQTIYRIQESKPEILLFDEIDANLDLETSRKVIENLSLNFNHTIKFFIIHNENLKNQFSKQIIFKNKKIVANF